MTQAVVFEIIDLDGNLVAVRSSRGESVVSGDAGELLRFMRFASPRTIRVFWNLDEAIAPILRKLPLGVLERLSKFDGELSHEGHELYYFPDRMFRVGLAKYYSVREFWQSHESEPRNIVEAQERVDGLLEMLEVVGLGNPRKLTSPIAVFEDSEWGKRVYDGIPRGADIPERCHEMIDYAAKADNREWVEAHQLGHFPELYNYDMVSAYPSQAAKLPDLRDLRIWKSDSIGRPEQGAVLGLVRGQMVLSPRHPFAHCSPIMAPVGDDGMPGNPLGCLPEDYYTLDEVNFVTVTGMGIFKFRDGWFANPVNETPRQPFRDVMVELFEKRSVHPFAKSPMKLIANGLVGKLIETRIGGEYGRLRNDIYHAVILAKTRIAVARFLMSNGVSRDELVCIQTDGVRATRDIRLSGTAMGSWQNKGLDPAVVVGPRKVLTKDKRPYQYGYDDIVRLVGEHPGKDGYVTRVRHRVTFKEAIRHYQDIRRVGEVVDQNIEIDLLGMSREQTRMFRKFPKTGRALLGGVYQSEPLVI